MTERETQGRGASGLLERLGAVFFAWRNWVFTVTLLGLLFAFRPVLFGGSRSADLWLDLLGLAISLAGQAIRTVVIGQTPIKSGGRMRQVSAEALVTTGLMSHVRNPLYIGNVLVAAGLTVIHNNPWVYGLLLPTTLLAYQAIVVHEEAFLTRQFGAAYQDYCRRVRRWLPSFQGLGRSLRETPFDGRRVMLQEYGSIYLAVTLPLLLMIYEQWSPVPGEASPRGEWLSVLVGLFLLATAAWAAFRRVKLQEVARRRALAALTQQEER